MFVMFILETGLVINVIVDEPWLVDKKYTKADSVGDYWR